MLAIAEYAFVALFRDAARSVWKGDLVEVALVIDFEQSRNPVETVEGRFAGKLPVPAQHRPVVLKPGDPLSFTASLHKTTARCAPGR